MPNHIHTHTTHDTHILLEFNVFMLRPLAACFNILFHLFLLSAQPFSESIALFTLTQIYRNDTALFLVQRIFSTHTTHTQSETLVCVCVPGANEWIARNEIDPSFMIFIRFIVNNKRYWLLFAVQMIMSESHLFWWRDRSHARRFNTDSKTEKANHRNYLSGAYAGTRVCLCDT